MWRQAKWVEPLIFELSERERETLQITKLEEEIKEYVGDLRNLIPNDLIRSSSPNIPNISEVEVVRHFIRLSQMTYGVDEGPVPLGSCTMKYNPKISEVIAKDPRITELHPDQDEETVQGILEILYLMQEWLAEITGMDLCTLNVPAGAAGELAGALMIKKYHEIKNECRDEMLIPDSAHGTNPASAAMAGFKVIKIKTDEKGNVDLKAIKAVLSEKTAGIMLTNPNTLGLFEENILEIAEVLHKNDSLLYYDGANLNGILGIVRPGDMGFDIVHLNLHKTFAAPHGGGGPGAGALCAKGFLANLLPKPVIKKVGRKYVLDYEIKESIGMIRAYYGHIIPIIKSFVYIIMLGPKGLKEVAEISTLNTNYFIHLIKDVKGITLPYDPKRPRKHEVVISVEELAKDTGVNAEDVAKALLNKGLHAPTIYFPLIVPEALMVEFTETETKEVIEMYANALREIVEESYKNPEKIKKLPVNTSVKRIDNVRANLPKYLAPSYKFVEKARRS